MGKPPPPSPPIPLFPTPPKIKLITTAKLHIALQAAINAVAIAGKPPPFSLTIVDLLSTGAGGDDYASATFKPGAEHYAASMLKVACLYAAHALRDLVQRFARARKPKDPDELFRMLMA